jgi:transcriptional regulator GlxA family with amidase domain
MATPKNAGDTRAMAVSPLPAPLLDATLRLASRLLDSPDEAHFLAPLVVREIVYRLWTGEQGGTLWRMARPGGHTQLVAQVVKQISRDLSQPLRVEEMARGIRMSVSSFHHHFKAVTAMSPLQFQKQLRLQEARRLLLNERHDAASAGFQVGYEDASHFNRDYKRLFGEPPMRDVERWRETALTGAGV